MSVETMLCEICHKGGNEALMFQCDNGFEEGDNVIGFRTGQRVPICNKSFHLGCLSCRIPKAVLARRKQYAFQICKALGFSNVSRKCFVGLKLDGSNKSFVRRLAQFMACNSSRWICPHCRENKRKSELLQNYSLVRYKFHDKAYYGTICGMVACSLGKFYRVYYPEDQAVCWHVRDDDHLVICREASRISVFGDDYSQCKWLGKLVHCHTVLPGRICNDDCTKSGFALVQAKFGTHGLWYLMHYINGPHIWHCWTDAFKISAANSADDIQLSFLESHARVRSRFLALELTNDHAR